MSKLAALDHLGWDTRLPESKMKAIFGDDFKDHFYNFYFAEKSLGFGMSSQLVFEENGVLYMVPAYQLSNEAPETLYSINKPRKSFTYYVKLEGELLKEITAHIKALEEEKNRLEKLLSHPSIRLKSLF